MIGGLLVQYLPIIDLSIDICHERDVCCKYFSPKEGLFGQMQMQIYAICTICSTLQYNTIYAYDADANAGAAKNAPALKCGQKSAAALRAG